MQPNFLQKNKKLPDTRSLHLFFLKKCCVKGWIFFRFYLWRRNFTRKRVPNTRQVTCLSCGLLRSHMLHNEARFSSRLHRELRNVNSEGQASQGWNMIFALLMSVYFVVVTSASGGLLWETCLGAAVSKIPWNRPWLTPGFLLPYSEVSFKIS